MQLNLLTSYGNRNSACFNFLITNNKDVRILELLEGLDLLVHVLISIVCLDTNAGILELILELLTEVVVLRLDGNESNLIRRHPEGECALVVLDQNTHETLDRSEDCTMQYNGLLETAFPILVGQTEVMRKLEVELYGTALPFTSKSILDLKVDLRAIECAVAFIYFVTALTVTLVEDLLQSCFCTVPDFDVTHEVIGTGRKLSTIGDTKGAVDLISDCKDVVDLLFDLGFHYEGMIIILTEFLYTEESVQLAGLLLTMDNIQLVVTDREFLVRMQGTLVGKHCIRAVHRLCCHGINII